MEVFDHGMAMPVQYPSNGFSRDFRVRIRNSNGSHEDHQIVNLVGAFSNPQSQLTCAAAASRKRSRHDPPAMDQSAIVASLLRQQTAEIDAVVRLQMEVLRSGIEGSRKRHVGAVASLLQADLASSLRAKESELATARLKNAELEESLRQVSVEYQGWFDAARSSEALVSSLSNTLDQLVVRMNEGYGDSDGGVFDDAQSTCFDDGKRKMGVAGVSPVAEAVAVSVRRQRGCRACGGVEEACVLLLPCRHLCLCRGCEPNNDTCPVCCTVKKACLQIFTS